jgi:hypothetical protein
MPELYGGVRPAELEHPKLNEEERKAVEHELEAFSDAIMEKVRLADKRYWDAVQAVRKAEGEAVDPMKDPSVRSAYLEVQALQGEFESAVEEARNIAAQIRSEAA